MTYGFSLGSKLECSIEWQGTKNDLSQSSVGNVAKAKVIIVRKDGGLVEEFNADFTRMHIDGEVLWFVESATLIEAFHTSIEVVNTKKINSKLNKKSDFRSKYTGVPVNSYQVTINEDITQASRNNAFVSTEEDGEWASVSAKATRSTL
ncbi:hypothetical protein SOPP22_02610 [Shewanella sp. OPT22]|nr:hypothetical protein SOPP22_02610 [Shewanella sp. OPT22]